MNWGKGIAIFLTVFVLFILGLVYLTTRSTFDLEADDYYAQEIAYQDRIEALSAGAGFRDALSIKVNPEDIVIAQNDNSMDSIRDGRISFYRPNDASLDRTFELVFTHGRCSIEKSEFIKGFYQLRIEWQLDDVTHALQTELMIP